MIKKYQKGQSLVLLLFFVLMAMTFAVTAILMLVVNSGSITAFESGIEVRQLADSGTENALLRLIRDPFYTGESYVVEDTNITITVAGSGTKTIIVRASRGEVQRTVEVLANYTDNVLRVASWKEEF